LLHNIELIVGIPLTIHATHDAGFSTKITTTATLIGALMHSKTKMV